MATRDSSDAAENTKGANDKELSGLSGSGYVSKLSRIACAFDPPNPKLFTLALRDTLSRIFGHGLALVAISRFS
jgi:hypothetical protein